ncbi:major facilitator superfamily domain-containing protein [Obelidium mucronatum]|nr:major facilitator superfamily domain-containing protein [Obelidium mucronatum]
MTWMRILTVASSCLVMATAGSLFSFSVISDDLKRQLSYSSSDLNTVSGVGTSALFLCFLVVGPLYDYAGARWTMFAGAVTYFLGYFLMYLAFIGRIPGNAGFMSLFYFIAGLGSTCAYMASIGINLHNYSKTPHEGKVVGVLLLFYGLSGTIYSQVYQAFFVGNPTSYLLFLAVSVGVVNFGCCFATFDSPSVAITTPVNQDKKSTSDTESNKDKSMTAGRNLEDAESPFVMLKSPLFWFFTITLIFMQGLTYMNNFMSILQATIGQIASSNIVETSYKNTTHVTIMSVFQSLGRLTFPLLMDLINSIKKNRQSPTSGTKSLIPLIDRSVLLIVTQILVLVPHLILATGAFTSESILYFTSAFIAFGFGGNGACFPVLTRDFFGSRFYGTACGFTMAGCSIGIIISNVVYGSFYDSVVVAVVEKGDSTCFGTQCYSKAFAVLTGIECIALLAAVGVVIIRTRKL